MRKTLIFDLDGTLVDSCAICIDILASMLADRGSRRAIDPAAARAMMSQGGERMVVALLGSECGDPAEELAEFRRRYAGRRTRSDTLFPQVAEGLMRLRDDGRRLAVCSNKPQNLCDNVLADTGLRALFSAVVGGQASLRPKPAPDLIAATLAAIEAAPMECLYIGDSEIDAAAAHGAGMPFLFMSYGYADAAYAHDPARSYDRFQDLTEAVLRGKHDA